MVDLTRLVGKHRLGYGSPEVRNLSGPKATLSLRGLSNLTECPDLPVELKDLYHSYTLDEGPRLPRSAFIEDIADVDSYCQGLDALRDVIESAHEEGRLPAGLKEVELDNLEKAGLRSGHRRFFYADRAGMGPPVPGRKISPKVWKFMVSLATSVRYEDGLQKAKRSSNLGYPLWVPGTHPMNPVAAVMAAKVAAAVNSGKMKMKDLAELTDWNGQPCFTLFKRAKDDRKFRPDYNLSPDGFTATTESRWAFEYLRKISAGPGIVNLGQKRLQKVAIKLMKEIPILRTESRVELGSRLAAFRSRHPKSEAISVDVSAFDESITRELRLGAESILERICPSNLPCYGLMQEMPLLLPPCYSGSKGNFEFYEGARIRSGEAGTMYFSSIISLAAWIDAACQVLRLQPREAYEFLLNEDSRGPLFLKIKGDDWAVETDDPELLDLLLSHIAELGLKTDKVPGFVLLMDFYPNHREEGSPFAYGLVSRAYIQTEARERRPTTNDLELLGLMMRWHRLSGNPLQHEAFSILRESKGFTRLLGAQASTVKEPGHIQLAMAKAGCFTRITESASSDPNYALQVLESTPGYHDIGSDDSPQDLLLREMFSIAASTATWDTSKAVAQSSSVGQLIAETRALAMARAELSTGDWALPDSVYAKQALKLEKEGLLKVTLTERKIATQTVPTKNIRYINYA